MLPVWLGTVSVVFGAFPALALAWRPVTAPEAIAHLNAIRSASGIPGALVEDSELSRGCELHAAYMATASNYRPGPGYRPHIELGGEPGATPLGARAAAVSDLAAARGGEGLARLLENYPDRFPWQNAPLHFRALLEPLATYAWFGQAVGNICMGVGGNTAQVVGGPPQFFSYPGNGAERVPTGTYVYSEWPYNPAEKAGFRPRSVIGPVIYLFSVAAGAPVSAEVTDANGRVPSRMVRSEPGFLFIERPLRPRSHYSVRVTWQLTPAGFSGEPLIADQEFQFTTGEGLLDLDVPVGPQTTSTKLVGRPRRVGQSSLLTLRAGNAVGRMVRVTYRPWRCTSVGWFGCSPTGPSVSRVKRLRARTILRLPNPKSGRPMSYLEVKLAIRPFTRNDYRYSRWAAVVNVTS